LTEIADWVHGGVADARNLPGNLAVSHQCDFF
jgi:hypothetical protein